MQTVDLKNINHVADYPFQDMPYKEPQLEMVEDSDGCIILSSATPLCELEKASLTCLRSKRAHFLHGFGLQKNTRWQLA